MAGRDADASRAGSDFEVEDDGRLDQRQDQALDALVLGMSEVGIASGRVFESDNEAVGVAVVHSFGTGIGAGNVIFDAGD